MGLEQVSDSVFRLLKLVKHAPSSFHSFIHSLVHLLIEPTNNC